MRRHRRSPRSVRREPGPTQSPWRSPHYLAPGWVARRATASPSAPSTEAIATPSPAHTDQPGNADSCARQLKVGQVTCVLQCRRDVILGEVRKLGDDLGCRVLRGQVSQNQCDRDSGPFDTGLSAKNPRLAHDSIAPCHDVIIHAIHQFMLTRPHSGHRVVQARRSYPQLTHFPPSNLFRIRQDDRRHQTAHRTTRPVGMPSDIEWRTSVPTAALYAVVSEAIPAVRKDLDLSKDGSCVVADNSRSSTCVRCNMDSTSDAALRSVEPFSPRRSWRFHSSWGVLSIPSRPESQNTRHLLAPNSNTQKVSGQL